MDFEEGCGCIYGIGMAFIVGIAMLTSFCGNNSSDYYQTSTSNSSNSSQVEYSSPKIEYTPSQYHSNTVESSSYYYTPRAKTPDDAYDEGYDEGYNHGVYDSNHGYSYGDSYDDSTDYYNYFETSYCEGYEDGYNDGYYG